jgi:hypothetical protein
MRGLTAGSHWTALLAGLIVAGVGVGLANPLISSTAIGVVAPDQSGVASGINSTFRQVGIAIGIAALGAVFESAISSSLAATLAATPLAGDARQLAHAVTSGGPEKILRSVPQGVARAIPSAYASAMNEILAIAGIAALVAAAVAALLVRGSDLAVHRRIQPAATEAGAGG